MDKIMESIAQSVADICDGAVVVIRGFTGSGVPQNLVIIKLFSVERKVKNSAGFIQQK